MHVACSRTHTHFKCAEPEQTRTIRRPVVYLCPVTIPSVSGAHQRGENNNRAAKKAGSNLAAPHRLFPYGRGMGWLVRHHRDVLALLTNAHAHNQIPWRSQLQGSLTQRAKRRHAASKE